MRAALLATMFSAACALCAPVTHALEADEVWPRLQQAHFAGRTPLADAQVVDLDAPDRAEDAAIVPMAIVIGPEGGSIRRAWLVIDGNPSPMAARFTLHREAVGRIETRVRIERYTTVRAVAETVDGRLFMATRFVKAAGGCSAPLGGDDEEARRDIGRMMLRSSGQGSHGEAELRIRHPNHSGLEFDLDTRGYVAADYLRRVTVRQDGELLMDAELDIAISRNPYLRFGFSRRAGTLEIDAEDSRERRFTARFPAQPAP